MKRKKRKATQMGANAQELNALPNRIIGCGRAVARGPGCGFLEKVYENALAHEITKAGMAVAQRQNLNVTYDGSTVGDYFADLLVEGAIPIALKPARALDDAHRAQCLPCLRATGLRLCLLMSFGAPRLEIRRIVRDP